MWSQSLCSVTGGKSGRGSSWLSCLELEAKFTVMSLALSNEVEITVMPWIIVGIDDLPLLRILLVIIWQWKTVSKPFFFFAMVVGSSECGISLATLFTVIKMEVMVSFSCSIFRFVPRLTAQRSLLIHLEKDKNINCLNIKGYHMPAS